MGKVRELRSRVHSAAVRLNGEVAVGPAPSAQEPSPPPLSGPGARGKDSVSKGTDIFAGTKIDLNSLMQKIHLFTENFTAFKRAYFLHCLRKREAARVSPDSTGSRLVLPELFRGDPPTVSDPGEGLPCTQGQLCEHTLQDSSHNARIKSLLSKKEKLKLRHERWLQKIEAIKLARQKQQEAERRRATEVVGDLRPLLEALPDLEELQSSSGSQQQKSKVTSKPRPTELSMMKATQRFQLLEEEMARFQALLASPAYQANPLQAIKQRLAFQIQMGGSSCQL